MIGTRLEAHLQMLKKIVKCSYKWIKSTDQEIFIKKDILSISIMKSVLQGGRHIQEHGADTCGHMSSEGDLSFLMIRS